MGELTKIEKEKITGSIEEGEVIEKIASFSWDGKNLVVRFPKDIANFLNVNEENRKSKKLKFLVVEKNGEMTREFEVIDYNGKEKKKK